MPYRSFVLICLCGLFLSGCSSTDDTIRFDNFILATATIIDTRIDDNSREYTIENKRHKTWDFLTIHKTTIAEDADHTTWVDSNTQILQQRYPQTIVWELQEDSITCWDEDIRATAIESSFATGEDEDPLYFVQYFFIHEDVAYVLIYSSMHKRSANRYMKLFSNIQCRL